MANKVYNKSIRRTIFGSKGRYLAILAIVALGVAFFVGVKDTKDSMLLTLDTYVNEHNMYDYRLISTLGFTEEDAEALAKEPEIRDAEGSVTADFFSKDTKGNSIVLRAHTLTENINTCSLVEGRMPKAANECVVDSNSYSEADIGKTIKIAKKNSDETKDTFKYDEYKIVGLVNNPYYLMITERGSGSLGNGTIWAFVYIPQDGFDTEYFTEMFVTCKNQGYVFSEEYDDNIKGSETSIEKAAKDRAMLRYDDIIAEAEAEIADGQAELDEGKASFEAEKKKVYNQLNDSKKQLDNSKVELESGQQKIADTEKQLLDGKAQLQPGIDTLSTNLDALKQADAAGMLTPEQQAQIPILEAQLQTLNTKMAEIDAGLAQLAGEKQKLDEGKKQLDDGYTKYYSGKAEADLEFAKAEAELADGQKQLDDARAELEELKAPEIYVQTRYDNVSYDSFDSNSDIVDSIAKVFPVFFFLIAALVCSTTMTRMVEEERVQIGSLRAMGYTKAKIMKKYMIYSGSAAVIGCIIGFFAGAKFFPLAIWIAYGMMFGFAPLEFYFSWPLALTSMAVSILCSMGTTYIACRGLLKHSPAEILRPPAPKAGKRILLERIGFIWNRMKFLHKVTARNILRYKKRMIMMVLGIGGCTALVIAGFGIHDSVAGLANHQYSKIDVYDMTVAFSEELTDEKVEAFATECKDEIAGIATLQQTAVSIKSDKSVKSSSMMITNDSNISEAVKFREYERPGILPGRAGSDGDADSEMLPYPKEGEAILSNKIAELLGLQVGDTFTVEYDDTKSVELTLSGIYRNYVGNFIYINDATFENIMNKEYKPDLALVTVKDGVDVYDASEVINGCDGVMGMSINEDIRQRVDDMMVSLNYIIILVIICAGLLAFIVLFNLGNINITEREREIATLEVLGFNNRETGAYVFRESFILVLIGIVAGTPMGYALHKFIMKQIIVDAVSFNEVIEPTSYLYSAVTVVIFAIIVDFILRRKLRKINMAEALKSIE